MPLMPDCLVMKLMELGNTLWLNHSKCTATPQTLPWYTTAFDTKWRSIMQYVHFGYDTNPKIPKRTSSPAHQLIFPALNWNCRKRVYVQILPSSTPQVPRAGSWPPAFPKFTVYDIIWFHGVDRSVWTARIRAARLYWAYLRDRFFAFQADLFMQTIRRAREVAVEAAVWMLPVQPAPSSCHTQALA